MKDLPVPPNVPEWALANLSDCLEPQHLEYLRAAVYAQLWRDEHKTQGFILSRFAVKNAEYDKVESVRNEAYENSELCAARMRELSK